ncbi:xanthine dehydrogenase family protein molybdopterin-binding subunit [Pseudorhodobacter sp. E13]|uniref:xanthine dehydrogenase family protein molybdopterin-binding subunit n=1 Tax=Pseudorhodobacter sp. E13 TaxID=2487931 RepID=UPI000F8E0957|nr:molybdopterin cofactor-binding domain-containing protein [Pseudorhodobacter sp. E13]RUS58982.1 xanthine dehydrogenase family protein molybdopterin-binding subunit [Pseudorhodobacter sp. E13]
MGRMKTIARRTFLIGSAAIAGGVVFGTYAYKKPIPNPLKASAITPYVLIDAQGITLIAPRAEMGQGVQTTLAALLAEEMDLDWDQVQVMHGPASRAYFNAAVLEEGVPFAPTDESWLAETARGAMHIPARFLGLQITGGSSSTPDAFDKMRAAGAVARVALVQAAARREGLDAAMLKTASGAVVLPDGRKIPYAELAQDAANSDLPEVPPLKPQSEWRLLGTSLPRKDMLGKVTGTAQFTADIRHPGMLFATARSNPGLGAGLASYDATAALALPGVEKVVEVPGGLAVVANSTWAAFKAAELISYDWEPAPYAATSEEMLAQTAASFTPESQDSRNRDDGDVEAALTSGDWSAEYTVPYLAHATMEPMTAGAWLQNGRLQVWAGNQLPTQVLKEAAAITGLEEAAIDVETPLMGGGFGRRAEMDFIKQAIHVAKAMEGRPVLLTWTREEDMTHDAYRPMAMARIKGAVADGKITALDVQLAAPSVMGSQMGRLGMALPGPDATIVQGAWEQPYTFPNYRTTGYRVPAGVPVGSWRSVGASQNAFFHESAVDELAHLAGVDPLELRLSQIDHAPSRKVLEAVAAASNWGSVPAGRARGLAFCLSFGVPTAQVIEVEQGQDGLRMTQAWAAVDVGTALDPSIIEAQVQGGMIFGLSAAIHGEITFEGGQAQQQNFPDYDALRLPYCPPISVAILQNGDKIRGVGEPGTPPAAPALANAIFAATGQRLRSLPLGKVIAFA